MSMTIYESLRVPWTWWSSRRGASCFNDERTVEGELGNVDTGVASAAADSDKAISEVKMGDMMV